MSNQKEVQYPKELDEMAKKFMVKVKKGEAKIYTNKNIVGQGYKFNEEE